MNYVYIINIYSTYFTNLDFCSPFIDVFCSPYNWWRNLWYSDSLGRFNEVIEIPPHKISEFAPQGTDSPTALGGIFASQCRLTMTKGDDARELPCLYSIRETQMFQVRVKLQTIRRLCVVGFDKEKRFSPFFSEDFMLDGF